MSNRPNRLISILGYKCPRCRKGNMYNQVYIWPLKTMLDMPEHCNVCGQKTEIESGFYFGTGYVSYALSVAFLVTYFVAFHIIIGLSIKNGTVIPCLISAIVFLILIQPWMMRISRILYLSMFVGYDENWEERNRIAKEKK